MKNNLLNLPLEILLKVTKYLNFSDIWYLRLCSKQSKKIGQQLIWHKYQIDLNKSQLYEFNTMIYSGLAYMNKYAYETIDTTIIQSISNRLVVEIYDKSPLKNWENCLDFFLDKIIELIIDYLFIDPLFDTLPITQTQKGKLITCFLSQFHSTLLGLFDTEPTKDIFHRLLLNHLHRHLDNISSNYNQSNSIQSKLKFKILIRFIGQLIHCNLLSTSDLNLLTHQRIQSCFSKRKRIKLYHSKVVDLEFQSDLSNAIFLLEKSNQDISRFKLF